MEVRVVSTNKNALSTYTNVFAYIMQQYEGYAEVIKVVEVPIDGYETMHAADVTAYILNKIGATNGDN